MQTYPLAPPISSVTDALGSYATRIVTRLAHLKKTKAVNAVTVADIASEIHSPAHRLTIGNLRQLCQTDKPAYSKQKTGLPVVLFGGEFLEAKDAKLTTHSGLMVMDFDAIATGDIDTLKHRLAQDPHTCLVFTSPSGAGLKWVVAVEAHDAESHRLCWTQAAFHAYSQYGLEADASGKDPSRKCFLTFDPHILTNEPKKEFSTKNRVVISGGTEGHALQEGQVLHEGQRDSICGSFSKKELLLSDLDLAPFLPDRPKANHNVFLWNLARLVKGYELQNKAQCSYKEIAALVNRWFIQSKPEFRPRSLDEYEGEFFDMLQRCRSPLNSQGEVWAEACAKADASPPPIALQETSEVSRRFIALCYYLSFGKRRSFALPQEKVAKHLKCTQPYICGRIAILERRGLLRKVASHSRYQRLAAEYEWTGDVYE